MQMDLYESPVNFTCPVFPWFNEKLLESTERGNWSPKEFDIQQLSPTDGRNFIITIPKWKQAQTALLDEIELYKQPGSDLHLDGEEVPDLKCLEFAQKFIRQLPRKAAMPATTIAGGEDVALYWRTGLQYLIVTFNADQTLSYFFNNKKTSSKSSRSRIDISQKPIPEDLLALIPSIKR